MKKKRGFIWFISHKNTLMALRIFLGLTFILASYTKIPNPDRFRAVVAEYQILPEFLTPLVAATLPWIEMLCGIMLVLGIFSQSNIIILIGVLLVFTFGISLNLYRGLLHDCGCFDFMGDIFGIKEEVSFGLVIRDIIFIIMSIPVLLFDKNVFFRNKSKRIK